MSKRVKVTINLSSQFIRGLQANLYLSGYIKNGSPARVDDADPVHILAMAVLGEAMGAVKSQVNEAIPFNRKDEIHVEHDERRVYDIEGRQLAGPDLVDRNFMNDVT